MRKIHILAALSAGLFAVAAPAQFEVQGRVEKLAKAPDCSKTATHRLRCTDIYLRAGKGVDLKAWENKDAIVKGGIVLARCVTLDVKAVEKPKYTLRISPFLFGKYRIGEKAMFRQTAPLLSVVPFVLGAKPGFLPLGPYGTYQMGLLSSAYFKIDVALLGFTLNIFDIPNDKRFVGATIYAQGLYVAVNQKGIDAKILNSDCFTIQGR